MKKSNSFTFIEGFIFTILLLVLCISFGSRYFFPILFIIVIGVAIYAIIDYIISTKNILYAELISRTDIYKTGYENTGFSFGFNGHLRFHYGKRKRFEGTDATFLVTYKNKNTREITVREGSKRYLKLLSYCGQETTSESVEVKPEEKIEIHKPLPVVTETISETKHYIDIPFEVLPNEFSLQVLFPSCQMVDTGERKEVHVRFEISYNANSKGVRNRRVSCAVIDSQDRIVSVMPDFHNLDDSGGRLVEIKFWKNIEEEPSRIRVGLEKAN